MSAFFETLENRQLLSVVPSTGAPMLASASTSTTATTLVLSGRTIHAEAGQKFTAVLGTISNLPAVQKPYTLHGIITWGDASTSQVVSPALFVHLANGNIAVIGSHTYAKTGTDAITVHITENPPPGSAAPVKVIGTIHSTADVITSKGGVTLEKTAGVKFTADVGTFSALPSAAVMTASINWGDGSTSVGKLVLIPVASPVAGIEYKVEGTHTYTSAKSYLINVTVTRGAAVTPGGQPIILVVAQWKSVADVLPVAPVTAVPLADVATSTSEATLSTTTAALLAGRTIHAEAGEKFTAVLGTISNLPAVQKPYTLHGTITWGDASNVQVVSPATFVHMGNGSIGVVGTHTYAAIGTDKITITISEIPPAGSTILAKLVGTIHSVADVIGHSGVTLQETTGVQFVADLGLFSSKLAESSLKATIDWGDGTTSIGKLMAIPVTGPSLGTPVAGGKFAVFGSHKYSTAKSYLVHVKVTTISSSSKVPVTVVVAQWNSVIDVLPPVPSATA